MRTLWFGSSWKSCQVNLGMDIALLASAADAPSVLEEVAAPEALIPWL
jgi:hypothetical protein